MQTEIERILKDTFAPIHLDVVNESYKHKVPPNAETHFKVTMASEAFAGKAPLARHRLVNQALAHPLNNGVHALSLKLYTPQQWTDADGDAHVTPPCASETSPAPQ